MASMMRRLSQTIHTKGRLNEIDAGDDIKVAEVDREEILVDFPSGRNSRRTTGQKENYSDTRGHGQQQRQLNKDVGTSKMYLETGLTSGDDDDAYDGAFLAFPEGGRKRSLSTQKPITTSPTTPSPEDEEIRMYLPPTVMLFRRKKKSIPTKNSSPPKEQQPSDLLVDVTERTECTSYSRSYGRHNIEPSEKHHNNDNDVVFEEEATAQEPQDPEKRSIQQQQNGGQQQPDYYVHDEFERPSNWISDDDSDSDSCNSEEYRQSIFRMAEERRAAEAPEPVVAPAVVEEPPPRRRQPRRSSLSMARARSRRNLQFSNINENNNTEQSNPFASGFEFAKEAPPTTTTVPRRRAARRPSLTATTYAFEATAAAAAAAQPPQRRRQRRASMSHVESSSRIEYANGLRAFGAKQHDIHHLLH